MSRQPNVAVTRPAVSGRVVDLPNAARYLGISAGKLHQLVRDGHVPIVRIPTRSSRRRGRLLFDLADLDGCIARWKQEVAS